MKLQETINTSHKGVHFMIWCETCAGWKSEFEVDTPGRWILCKDCNEGLVMVVQ
jgi:hypothetical protein